MKARIATAVEEGDLSLVPDLLACLWGPHPDSAEVADAVDELVRHMPVGALGNFEQGLRGWLRGQRFDLRPPPTALTRIQPDQVRELRRFGEAGNSLFGILAGHPNGFVREAAVGALAGVETGRELPFLILRLNDWAPQVRYRARVAVRARLHAGYGDAFIQCIELIERMGGWAQLDESELRGEIGRFLRSPENRPALVRAISSSEAPIRRAAYRELLAAPDADMVPVLARALQSTDAVLRHLTLRNVSRLPDSAPLRELLETMQGSPSGQVRAKGLRMLHRLDPAAVEARTEALLLDVSSAVRSLAIQWSGLDRTRLAVFYRRQLPEACDATLPGVIAGLGEMGDRTDAASLAPLVSHARIRIRRAAIRALVRVAPNEAIEPLLKALSDDTPGVSAESRRALAPLATRIGAARLIGVLEGSHTLHVRLNVLHLVAELPPWEGLPHLLETLRNPDSTLAEDAERHLSRWLNNPRGNMMQPSHFQLDAARAALRAHGRSLSDGLEDAIDFVLRTANPR